MQPARPANLKEAFAAVSDASLGEEAVLDSTKNDNLRRFFESLPKDIDGAISTTGINPWETNKDLSGQAIMNNEAAIANFNPEKYSWETAQKPSKVYSASDIRRDPYALKQDLDTAKEMVAPYNIQVDDKANTACALLLQCAMALRSPQAWLNGGIVAKLGARCTQLAEAVSQCAMIIQRDKCMSAPQPRHPSDVFVCLQQTISCLRQPNAYLSTTAVTKVGNRFSQIAGMLIDLLKAIQSLVNAH